MSTNFEVVSVEGLTFTQERLNKMHKTLKADVHLVSKEKKVIGAHRFVLAMFSTVLAKELRFANPNGATFHPVMDCASSSLELMVDLFYKGKAKVPSHKADDFKELLSFWQVKGVKEKPKQETEVEDKKVLKKSALKALTVPKASAVKKDQPKQCVKRTKSNMAVGQKENVAFPAAVMVATGSGQVIKKKNAAINTVPKKPAAKKDQPKQSVDLAGSDWKRQMGNRGGQEAKAKNGAIVKSIEPRNGPVGEPDNQALEGSPQLIEVIEIDEDDV